VYRRAVTALTRRRFRQLGDGNAGPLLGSYAEDVSFHFCAAGELSIATERRDDVAAWFDRMFAALGPRRYEVHEVVVAGPPWRMRVVTRYVLHAEGRQPPLRCHGMQIAHLRWGRILAEWILPDTAALASYLADPAPAAPERTAPGR
jgi:ketosteroid isomerase-like protein